MTRQYPTAETYQHRVIAQVIVSLAILLLLGAGILVFSDTGPFSIGKLFLLTPGIGLMGLGVYFWRRRRATLEVDLALRQATLRAQGRQRWKASLDDLVPLAIVSHERKNYSQGESVETEYRVVTKGAHTIPLYSNDDYPRCRRFAERLARQWRVAFTSFDGRVRQFEDLDRPLAIDLIDSDAAPAAASQYSLTLHRSPERVVVRSRARLGGAEFPNLLWLLVAGIVPIALPIPVHYDLVLADPTMFPTETATIAGAALGMTIALGLFMYQTWAWLQPPTLIVDRTSVRYGRQRVLLDDVREIVWAGSLYILGSRRTMEIPTKFYGAQDEAALIALLRQLIREYRAPAART